MIVKKKKMMFEQAVFPVAATSHRVERDIIDDCACIANTAAFRHSHRLLPPAYEDLSPRGASQMPAASFSKPHRIPVFVLEQLGFPWSPVVFEGPQRGDLVAQ